MLPGGTLGTPRHILQLLCSISYRESDELWTHEETIGRLVEAFGRTSLERERVEILAQRTGTNLRFEPIKLCLISDL